jgi:endonuclease/exonuclease/phosphatase family metal-dependent hydrolase
MPDPDIILLNEVDRGRERSGWGSVAREYAMALGMCYVYGVEFIELPRFWGPGGGRLSCRCEHGNAVLSRYPLGNVRLIRHEKNLSWYSWWQRLLRVGEPRMGGRMALAADLRIGERYLHLYSLHLESRHEDEYRSVQSAEVAEDGLRQQFGVIAGGDLNCVRYIDDLRMGTSDDPVTQALIQRGYVDAHATLPVEDRVTTRSGVAIDLIVGRGVTFLGAGIGSKDKWGELSDHLPVWAKLRLQ